MSYNPNRLQFVHCETCFENSAKAREYVNGNLITRDRPALYAEPMILKYGDPKNPNILLAIGSVGDGKTGSIDNKVFFIDCAQLDIDNNFEFVNTNTISFDVEKNESGTTINPNVLLQPSKIVDKKEYNNVILDEENGLFTHINTEVIDDQIIVNINGEIKSYDLPDPVIKGLYDKENLTLSLFTKKNEEIKIDFKNVVLISDNDKNIIVKREDGLYANVDLSYDKLNDKLTFNNGVEVKEFNLLSSTQDTINKDVNEELKSLKLFPLESTSITNVIQKSETGTSLKSDVILSDDPTNVLRGTDKGIFASVDFKYDDIQNKLTLITSNGKKEIQLVNQSFLESISYDKDQKKIILRVKLSDGQIITQEIDMTDLFNPYIINIENDANSPIRLEKTSITDTENGNVVEDKITAHLNVVGGDDNAIKIRTEGSQSSLFASNNSKDIKVIWSTLDEDGNLSDPDYTDVQTAFFRTVNYFDNNDKENAILTTELTAAKERITTLENELKALTDYVKKLTDFGFTENEKPNDEIIDA